MRIRETIDWGIYLGVNKSSLAVFNGRDVKVIKNNAGDEFTPYAVYEKRIGNNISKLIGKTAKNKLLSRNKFSSRDIEKVILIGGPTLSPHLMKMIEDGLQIPRGYLVDPLTAAASCTALCAKGKLWKINLIQ